MATSRPKSSSTGHASKSSRSPDGPAGEILETFGAKSYASIAVLTLKIWDIARRDSGISLDAAFETNRQAQQALNQILNERLGIRSRVRVNQEEVAVVRPDVRSFFAVRPAARANYAHRLKRAARIAAGLLDLQITRAVFENGSLVITGGRTKATFGADTVGLGDRVTDGQRTPVPFADIEDLAREKRNRKPARGRQNGESEMAPGALGRHIGGLRKVLKRRRSWSPDQRAALRALQDIIAQSLGKSSAK